MRRPKKNYISFVLTVIGLSLANQFSPKIEAQQIIPVYKTSHNSSLAKKTGRTFQELASQSRFKLQKARTYEHLAKVYAGRKLYKQALAEVKKGLKIDPYDIPLRNLAGYLLIQTGDTIKGSKQLRFVLKISPGNGYAKKTLQSLEAQLRRPALVKRNYVLYREREERAEPGTDNTSEKDEQPGSFKNPYYLDLKNKRTCLAQMKTIQTALDSQTKKSDKLDLESLVKSNLLNILPLCPQHGVYSLIDSGENGASSLFCSIHKKKKDMSEEIHTFYKDFIKAARFKSSKDYINARATYKKILNFHPNWGELYYHLADISLQEDLWQQGLDEIREAIKINNRNADYHFLEFMLLTKVGESFTIEQKARVIINRFPQTIYSLACQKALRSRD